MIKKFCLVTTASMFIAMTSFSQTIKENIEKQSKDPKTIDNAAKADVYVVGDKKKISDPISAPGDRKSNAKIGRKKKKGGKP
jgi:hypothetical protein